MCGAGGQLGSVDPQARPRVWKGGPPSEVRWAVPLRGGGRGGRSRGGNRGMLWGAPSSPLREGREQMRPAQHLERDVCPRGREPSWRKRPLHSFTTPASVAQRGGQGERKAALHILAEFGLLFSPATPRPISLNKTWEQGRGRSAQRGRRHRQTS